MYYGNRGTSIVQHTTVAVIGCGYWGKHLVRNFHHLGALAVVCDLTPAGQQTARALAPQATIVASVEAALAAPVAGVVIATPAETHYALVQQALAAEGKPSREVDDDLKASWSRSDTWIRSSRF